MLTLKAPLFVAAAIACSAFGTPFGAEAKPAGVLTVAIIGEPPSLDVMSTTVDLVSTISQHIFETLYTFDAQWKPTPLLAAAPPVISDDGKVYLIKLRKDVKFHDGATMTVADVQASLERWMKTSPRGKQVAAILDSLSAPDDSTIRIALKQNYAPLMSLLAFNNGAAVVMPKALATNEGPLKEFIGTGPFKLLEHKPDQYIRLAAFADYTSAPGAASGYAGKREAEVEELRFVVTPNAVTRVDSVLSGQVLYADSLPTEMLGRLKGQDTVKPVIIKPFAWPFMIMNNKSALTGNVDLRRAMQSALSLPDMLMAAFGDPQFFAVKGPFYDKDTPFFSEAGARGAADPKKAADLLKKAGYKGQPIRIMTSTQYDFLYKMSLVAQQNLQDAGFTVDLQVLDWATLVQRRNDPNAWDALFTFHTFVPEPSLITILNPTYAGWWDTPEKNQALAVFNGEPDPAKRAAAWGQLQAVFFDQVPTIKVGDFYSLAAASSKLTGLVAAPWPFFWNVSVKP